MVCCPFEGVIRCLFPSGFAERVVRTVRELLEVRDGAGVAVKMVVGAGHRCRSDVVFAACNEQERRAVRVVEIHACRRMRVEVGKARLKQNVVGAGNGVTVIHLPGLLLAHQVAESVMKLFRRESGYLMVIERVAESGKRNPQGGKRQQQDAFDGSGVERDACRAQSPIQQKSA